MKPYREFISEVNKRQTEKLNYQYGERNKPENYLPKDSLLDLMKQKKGLKTAQIVPPSKNSPVSFKYSTIGIDTTDREKGLRKNVERLERLGILHGGTRGSDLYDKLP